MRSTSPTEVPPYFWTMRAMVRRTEDGGRKTEDRGLRTEDRGAWSGSVGEVGDPEQERTAEDAGEATEPRDGRADRFLVALMGGENERGGARVLARPLGDVLDADATARGDTCDLR